MRIVEDTPERLTVESRPWVLGIILAVVILLMLLIALGTIAENLGLGLGMLLGAGLFGLAFVVFVRREIVIFDRGAGAVVIRSVSLLGQTEKTLALSAIHAARVDTSITSASSIKRGRRTLSHTHRPVLDTDAGEVPLSAVHSGGDGASKAAEAINRWLGTVEPSNPEG